MSKAITRFICVSRALHTERISHVESVLHKKKNVELGDQNCQKVLKKKQRFRRRLSQTHVIMWYFCR